MTHRRAVALLILCTLMWSIAGVVTRHLDAARSFEVTFWRSGFNATALLVALLAMRGSALFGDIRRGGIALWFSALCWATMYTNFMLALTLTTVATVLVTMAIAPLVTALFARLFLHHRLPARTWAAIGLAGLGIAWMFGRQALAGHDACDIGRAEVERVRIEGRVADGLHGERKSGQSPCQAKASRLSRKVELVYQFATLE